MHARFSCVIFLLILACSHLRMFISRRLATDLTTFLSKANLEKLKQNTLFPRPHLFSIPPITVCIHSNSISGSILRDIPNSGTPRVVTHPSFANLLQIDFSSPLIHNAIMSSTEQIQFGLTGSIQGSPAQKLEIVMSSQTVGIVLASFADSVISLSTSSQPPSDNRFNWSLNLVFPIDKLIAYKDEISKKPHQFF